MKHMETDLVRWDVQHQLLVSYAAKIIHGARRLEAPHDDAERFGVGLNLVLSVRRAALGLGWLEGSGARTATSTVARDGVARVEAWLEAQWNLVRAAGDCLPCTGGGDADGDVGAPGVAAAVPWYLDARVIRPDDADMPLKHFWAYAAGYAAACYGEADECPLPKAGDIDGLLRDSWEFGASRWDDDRMPWWLHPVSIPVIVQGIFAARNGDHWCPYQDDSDAAAEWTNGFNLAMSTEETDCAQVAELLAPYLPIIEKLDALPPFPADDEADVPGGTAEAGGDVPRSAGTEDATRGGDVGAPRGFESAGAPSAEGGA